MSARHLAGILLLAVAPLARAGEPRAPRPPAWVYHAGTFYWPGDYSFVGTPDYADRTGQSPGGRDIAFHLTGPWGGWQPYARNWAWDSTGYTRLQFRLKPTQPGQRWATYFIGVGDVELNCHLDVLKYGPPPVVGQWATYTIPLADYCVLGKPIYKFAIQDQTGRASNLWYVDDVGFLP